MTKGQRAGAWQTGKRHILPPDSRIPPDYKHYVSQPPARLVGGLLALFGFALIASGLMSAVGIYLYARFGWSSLLLWIVLAILTIGIFYRMKQDK